MSTGVVREASFSGGGKPKANIEGMWYFMPDGVDVPSIIGKKIDFESKEFNSHGKWFKSVIRWAVSPLAEQPAQQPQRLAAVNSAPAAMPNPVPEPTQRALSTLFDHELRFISNVIGSALTGSQIKEPNELRAWFDAAVECLTGTPINLVMDKAIERSDQTKRANEYASRIYDAVNKGRDDIMMSVWAECEARTTGDEAFEASVWTLLSTPVRNRIKDLMDRKIERGELDSMEAEIPF
jgi:hypothetical protein